MWEIKIVLTGVFDDVGIQHQARLFLYHPRLGIDLGVIDRNFRSPDVGWKNGWAKENGMSRILESSQAKSLFESGGNPGSFRFPPDQEF